MESKESRLILRSSELDNCDQSPIHVKSGKIIENSKSSSKLRAYHSTASSNQLEKRGDDKEKRVPGSENYLHPSKDSKGLPSSKSRDDTNASGSSFGGRRNNRGLLGKHKRHQRAFSAKRKIVQDRPVYFNIMLCGKSGVGKTLFLERFLRKVSMLLTKQTFGKSNVIKMKADKITEYVVEKNEDGLRYVLTAIDVPGYSESTPIKEWYEAVKKFTQKKTENYEDIKKAVLKDTTLGYKNLVDCRIHLCLYFVAGHRLQLNDVIYMKKLQKYINLVPVISSFEDDVDEDEIEAYKAAISNEIHDYNLELFDYEREAGDFEDIKDGLEIDLIRPYPPFWFQAKPFEDMEDIVEHDFKLLSFLLVSEIAKNLVERTEIIWNIYNDRKKKKDRKKKEIQFEKNYNLGVGVALGLGVIGAIMAVKNTLL